MASRKNSSGAPTRTHTFSRQKTLSRLTITASVWGVRQCPVSSQFNKQWREKIRELSDPYIYCTVRTIRRAYNDEEKGEILLFPSPDGALGPFRHCPLASNDALRCRFFRANCGVRTGIGETPGRARAFFPALLFVYKSIQMAMCTHWTRSRD